MPGETVEIRPMHKLELKSITTDKDFYLSGQNVRLSAFLTDSGTRSGKEPMTADYMITRSRSETLLEARKELVITPEGSELSIDWEIPSTMDSGSLDVTLEISDEHGKFLTRKSPGLINVEQPIILNFAIVRPPQADGKQAMRRYLLEGESVLYERAHHGLKLVKLSSNTSLLMYDDKVVGGTGWSRMGQYKIKAVENLYFSHIMLSRGLRVDNLQDINTEWNELGRIWSAKLVNAGAGIHTREAKKDFFSFGTRTAFNDDEVVLKHSMIEQLKGIRLDGATLSQWNSKIFGPVKGLKLTGDKRLREIIKHSYSERYGRSVLDLTLEYLEKDRIADKGRMAKTMKDYLDILDRRVYPKGGKYSGSLSEILSRWYHSLKDVKIEVELDDEVARILDLLYCVVILKMIDNVTTITGSVISQNKIMKEQFIDLCFAMVNYHMLCLERLVNNIQFDRFLDEDVVQKELDVHFKAIEKIGDKLELILTGVMGIIGNQRANMELRLSASLLLDAIELDDDSRSLNGLSGEQVKKQLVFKNRSGKAQNFNILLAFPSPEWHLLEPEANLIDGVYWRENISIKPKGKYREKITLMFPKSLSLQEYTSLIKFEPVELRLLDE